jgi:hypothetical protein
VGRTEENMKQHSYEGLSDDLQGLRKGPGLTLKNLERATTLLEVLACKAQAESGSPLLQFSVAEARSLLLNELNRLGESIEAQALRNAYAVGLERNPGTVTQRRSNFAGENRLSARTIENYENEQITELARRLEPFIPSQASTPAAESPVENIPAELRSKPMPQPIPTPSAYSRRGRLFAASVATLLLLGIVAVIWWVTSNVDNDPPRQPSTAVVITVQNKVALGPDRLVEDTGPAYLSTKPEPFCADRGCKVPDTEVGSGARLVAVCYVHGTETMYNYNLDSSQSKSNPHRAESTLWYKVVLHDGRSGYISEVYIQPADRGGLGLPVCR